MITALRCRTVGVVAAFVLVSAVSSRAQDATGSARPFEITDNSFLVEEAFNQEAGIFQNILVMNRGGDGRWDDAYTQEWPLGGMAHQISYTVPFAFAEGVSGVGDVLLNYRYQALEEHGRVPAFSPRLSLVMARGSEELGFGAGDYGWQVNLPVSKQYGDLYVHVNAGGTYMPHVRASQADTTGGVALWSPMVAGSAIVRVAPMLNLLVETVVFSNASLDAPGVVGRTRGVTLSPGFRKGWNLGDQQVVFGLASPVTFERGGGHAVSVLSYFSYELPFASRPAGTR